MLDRYIKQNEGLKELNIILENLYNEEQFETYVEKFCKFLERTSIDLQNMSPVDNFNFFCPMEIVIQLKGKQKIISSLKTCKNDSLKILIDILKNIKE